MGPALRPAPFRQSVALPLGRQLANPGRPVRDRGPRAWAVARATARAEQVVAGAAGEERAAPVGVVAGAGDVLAGDPDRVAVHGRCPVVTPAGARRVAD